jgi:hypothetical protein
MFYHIEVRGGSTGGSHDPAETDAYGPLRSLGLICTEP